MYQVNPSRHRRVGRVPGLGIPTLRSQATHGYLVHNPKHTIASCTKRVVHRASASVFDQTSESLLQAAQQQSVY